MSENLQTEVWIKYYNDIKDHLTKDGIILLQEQSYASGPAMFEADIKNAGLVIHDVYWENNMDDLYYLVIKHK